MTISIYDPRVRAEALRHGITELQAYRNLNAREVLREREAEKRRGIISRFVDRICTDYERKNPDWNDY